MTGKAVSYKTNTILLTTMSAQGNLNMNYCTQPNYCIYPSAHSQEIL